MNDWIKCSDDSLPDDGVHVLIYDGSNYCVAYHTDYYGVWEDSLTNHDIQQQPTHWMPLPEPPDNSEVKP